MKKLSLLFLAVAAGAAAQSSCDRACLEGFVNQYLDALVARNPFGLPLAPKIKFTENDQPLEFGDGLWNVTTAISNYKLYVSDPQSGEVGFLGTLRENDTPVALVLRLKIESRKISEIETLVLRGGTPNYAAQIEQLGNPNSAFLEAVPRAQRLSRQAMLQVSNKYFDAIETGTDTGVFANDCERIGDGFKVTHNPDFKLPGLDWNPFALGCADQIRSHIYDYIHKVSPRRLPVIDEERQLVFSFSTFQIPGDRLSVESPGHGTYKFQESDTAPYSMAAPEIFRIKGGKITRVENLTVNLPYGTRDPFAEAAPAPARTTAPPQPSACDRGCLESFVNRYLDALVAHDPKRIPVTADIKFAEDDVPLRLGEALWRTASGLGHYRLYFSDPQAGQVAFFGTIQENGRGAALVLRLKVEGGRISEAEQLVLRNTRTYDLLEKAGKPDPLLTEPIAAADRLPRNQLIATANTYFEAIEQGNGKVAPFDPQCDRFENGMRTTGAEGCSAQLDTHVFDYIQKIYPRRFLVVDEERQVVFGFFMFNHPGDILWVDVPGQGRHDMPAAAKRPFSVDVAEAFKITNGNIRKVEALMTSLPYARNLHSCPSSSPRRLRRKLPWGSRLAMRPVRIIIGAAFVAAVALLAGTSSREEPLWPGARFNAADRDRAERRGLHFLYSAARVPETFRDFGADLLSAFANIAGTNASRAISDLARRMGRERALAWRRTHSQIPPDASPDEVADLVFGSDAADSLGVPDPRFQEALRHAASHFSAADYLGFDPTRGPPPAKDRYELFQDALITAYTFDRHGIPFGAHYADVLRWLSFMHPYPPRAADRYYDAVYAATHLVYTYNGYNQNRIAPHCFPQEFGFLNRHLTQAIADADPETLGECLDTLQAFGVTWSDRRIRHAVELLLATQNSDGSWGNPRSPDTYVRYHSTWTALNGIQSFRWTDVLPCPVSLLE